MTLAGGRGVRQRRQWPQRGNDLGRRQRSGLDDGRERESPKRWSRQ